MEHNDEALIAMVCAQYPGIAEAIIKPKAKAFTPDEYQLAMHRFLIDRVQDELVNLEFEIGCKELSDTGEIFRMIQAITDMTNYDQFFAQESIKTQWELVKRSLSGYHVGDCTASAQTCMRCYAEQYFEMNSVSWKNKSEGYALLQQCNREMKLLHAIMNAFNVHEATARIRLSDSLSTSDDAFSWEDARTQESLVAALARLKTLIDRQD